jgi:hypothetical protein
MHSVAAALVAIQRRCQHERAALPTRRRTIQHLPLNLSPKDKDSYKPKEMIHVAAIDKQKALPLSDEPVLAT